MDVKLHGAISLSETAVAAFEKDSGIELPREYREFVLVHDGAKPESNLFEVSEDISAGVSRFIQLKETIEHKLHIDGVSCAFLPVAEASCGNYVCLDLDEGGRVFFWDHEEPSSALTITEDFTGFLDLLKPFNPSMVELKPEQVVSVWVSPKLRKRMEEKKREESAD